MRISLKTLADKCIWALTAFLLVLFVIFGATPWGRYAFFGASILAVLLSAVYSGMVLRIRIQAYHLFFLAFALYALISAAWSVAPSDAIDKFTTLMQVLLCSALLYIHYDRSGDMTGLIRAVMWSGYLVSLYTLAFYGVDRILAQVGDVRFGSDFSNANTMGMVAALTCVLQVSELLRRRKPWTAIFMVPALIVVAAVQSRKALVMLLVGILAVFLFRGGSRKGFANKVFQIIGCLAVALAGLWLLIQLPMFSGLLIRLERMLAYWTGEGRVDSSTLVRNQLMKVGFDLFREHPVFGVGIGNSHVYALQRIGIDAYLHNNYAELLSGGGIVGFGLYYGAYAYIIVGLLRYRKADPEKFAIGLIWVLLMLVMQYGMVSYYSKLQWYYMMFHFLNVAYLKKKHGEMQSNAEKAGAEGN